VCASFLKNHVSLAREKKARKKAADLERQGAEAGAALLDKVLQLMVSGGDKDAFAAGGLRQPWKMAPPAAQVRESGQDILAAACGDPEGAANSAKSPLPQTGTPGSRSQPPAPLTPAQDSGSKRGRSDDGEAHRKRQIVEDEGEFSSRSVAAPGDASNEQVRCDSSATRYALPLPLEPKAHMCVRACVRACVCAAMNCCCRVIKAET
jgi:hypothetical protein